MSELKAVRLSDFSNLRNSLKLSYMAIFFNRQCMRPLWKNLCYTFLHYYCMDCWWSKLEIHFGIITIWTMYHLHKKGFIYRLSIYDRNLPYSIFSDAVLIKSEMIIWCEYMNSMHHHYHTLLLSTNKITKCRWRSRDRFL